MRRVSNEFTVMKIAIITEVLFDVDGTSSDRSFMDIITAYSVYAEEVLIIAPSESLPFNITSGNIKVHGISFYSKKKRLINPFVLKKSLPDLTGYTLQYRIPSVFALQMKVYLSRNIREVLYVAGDWCTSFKSNYRFLGSGLVGLIMDRTQIQLFKQIPAVTAGSFLSHKWSKYNPTLSYVSVSHNEVINCIKDSKKLNIVYVGRIEGLKQPRFFLDIADSFRNDDSVNFTMVGANILGIDFSTHNVNYLGVIKDWQILSEIYRSSHILCLPSISEGTPKVVSEAMSFGCVPLTISNVGSIGDIYNSSQGLFLENDHYKWIQSIKFLSRDRATLDRLSIGALRRAEEITLNNQVSKVFEFYEKDHYNN